MLQGLPLEQAQALFTQAQAQQQAGRIRAQQPPTQLQQSQIALNQARTQQLQQTGGGATEIARQAAIGKLRDDRRALEQQNIGINSAVANRNMTKTEGQRRIAVNNKRIRQINADGQRLNQLFRQQPTNQPPQPTVAGGFLSNLLGFGAGQGQVTSQAGRTPEQRGDLPDPKVVEDPLDTEFARLSEAKRKFQETRDTLKTFADLSEGTKLDPLFLKSLALIDKKLEANINKQAARDKRREEARVPKEVSQLRKDPKQIPQPPGTTGRPALRKGDIRIPPSIQKLVDAAFVAPGPALQKVLLPRQAQDWWNGLSEEDKKDAKFLAASGVPLKDIVAATTDNK